MISSTPKVAIPAARPERRISGSPTRSAYTPPTAAAASSDGTLPIVWSRSTGKRYCMIAGFSETGTERTPAVQAPTATKLMCPNETTPEFPTKT